MLICDFDMHARGIISDCTQFSVGLWNFGLSRKPEIPADQGNLRKWQYKQVTTKIKKTFRYPAYHYDRDDTNFDKGTFEIIGF